MCGQPPTIRTFPLDSSVIPVPVQRGVFRLPVGVQLPVLGSYTSALARAFSTASSPPATRTLPFGSRMAEWTLCASLILPVGVQLPVLGSYTSALARG